MVTTKFHEDLFKKLEQKLNVIHQRTNNTKNSLIQVLQAVKSSLDQLRGEMERNPFESEDEEIYFFKFLKPKFYACWLLAFEKHQLVMRKPTGTEEMVRSFLEDELRLIQRYFSQNAFYYHYYRSGDTELDSLYFVRNSGIKMITVPEISELENGFSTPCDLLFSKFIAYEQFQEYVLGLLSPKMETEKKIDGRKKVASPTKVNLSVDQLGLIARAADDARLLMGRSFSKICEDLAPHLATAETQQISPQSLRSNAYTGEDTDKNVSIRMLEKMIKFIKDY